MFFHLFYRFGHDFSYLIQCFLFSLHNYFSVDMIRATIASIYPVQILLDLFPCRMRSIMMILAPIKKALRPHRKRVIGVSFDEQTAHRWRGTGQMNLFVRIWTVSSSWCNVGDSWGKYERRIEKPGGKTYYWKLLQVIRWLSFLMLRLIRC